MSELESFRDGREQGQRDMQKTVERLQTINAELVEALSYFVENPLPRFYGGITLNESKKLDEWTENRERSRAMLAKVKEGE